MNIFRKFTKWHAIILTIVAALIIFRLMLPTIVKNYVNKVLADLKGYHGHVEDIDIWLIRGAYVIKDMKIDKTGGKVPVPFVYAKSIDLSVEWRALLDGGIRAKVIFDQPLLNFVAGPTKETTQTGVETDWTESLKKLLPIDINRFEIHEGKVKYSDFYASPKVDIFINKLELVATNLSNLVDEDEKLPSDVTVSGSSIGGGKLSIVGKMNVLKKMPDVSIDFKFNDINLVALNDFATAYGKFDFEKGTLSILSELTLYDGKLEGYVKPIIEKVDVLDWQDDGNFVQTLWQAAIGATFQIFKNHPKDRFATKIPIQGDLNEKVQINVIISAVRVLRNGFVEAYKKTLDTSASFSEDDKKEKKKKFLIF